MHRHTAATPSKQNRAANFIHHAVI